MTQQTSKYDDNQEDSGQDHDPSTILEHAGSGCQNVVIHVGKHKVASTYMQHLIFPQLTKYYCTKTGVMRWLTKQPFIPANFREKVYNNYFDKSRRGTSPGRDDLLLISREGLSSSPDLNRVDKYAESLSKAYPQARVLICIREQYDLMVTLFFWHTAKRRMTLNLPKYADWVMDYAPQFLLHHEAVDAYVKWFGKDRVTVMPYELNRLSKDNFIHKVAEWISPEVKISIPDYRMNVSFKTAAVLRSYILVNHSLLRVMAYFMPSMTRILPSGIAQHYRHFVSKFSKQNLAPFINRIFPGSQKIEPGEEIRRKWDATFADSNSRIEEALGISLAEFGYVTTEKTN